MGPVALDATYKVDDSLSGNSMRCFLSLPGPEYSRTDSSSAVSHRTRCRPRLLDGSQLATRVGGETIFVNRNIYWYQVSIRVVHF